MNLAPNELFDPKDNGIIYIYEETHLELSRIARAVANIIKEKFFDGIPED